MLHRTSELTRISAALAVIGASALLHSVLPASAADGAAPSSGPSSSGPSSAASVAGEFDGDSAMALAVGEVVKTNCSVNWQGSDGKTYCFSNDKAKEIFLQNPDENVQKAKEYFVAKDIPTTPVNAVNERGPAPAEPIGTADTAPSALPPGANMSPIPTAAPAKEFTEDDVDAEVKKVVDARSKDGAFVFHDPKLDTDLHLVFEQIKFVRGMEGYGWFANLIFHDKAEPKKQYALDFWFKPEGDKLTLMDIRVQKGPQQDGNGYTMITRMPVAWWWLPVEEHPGDMEVTRAWQVMSSIHNYIATHKDKDGHLDLKDIKTGQSVPLDFVEIHQPVRHLKSNGQYFVCTDFRKPGSKDEYYDIDFWVNQQSGKLEVKDVKIHKVPAMEDGHWTEVPRYTFNGMKFDEAN